MSVEQEALVLAREANQHAQEALKYAEDYGREMRVVIGRLRHENVFFRELIQRHYPLLADYAKRLQEANDPQADAWMTLTHDLALALRMTSDT